MKLVSREDLKEKLNRGDDFKLVMAWDDRAFRLKHIPGSINIYPTEVTSGMLDTDDDIVVYCSGPACPASVIAYQRLTASGYNNVQRYAGGVSDWEEAGYSLEGEAPVRTSRELFATLA